jgi:hypothetical protein
MLLDNGRDKDRNRRERRRRRGGMMSAGTYHLRRRRRATRSITALHTLGMSVKLNPKYFLIVQREEGRKENLPSDRRAHYSSMTKWRWKKREKE